MILSGMEIAKRRISSGTRKDPVEGELFPDIVIDPYRKENLNPNSYNITLHNELMEVCGRDMAYDEQARVWVECLDMKKPSHTIPRPIPSEGLVLFPGVLYLGRTQEYTETRNLVPMLEGRSSVGRHGMFIHVTAGFGDIGFCGFWTLEIVVVRPLKIYPNVQVGQLFYHTVEGALDMQYTRGKYSHNTGIQTSRLWQELGGELPNGSL